MKHYIILFFLLTIFHGPIFGMFDQDDELSETLFGERSEETEVYVEPINVANTSTASYQKNSDTQPFTQQESAHLSGLASALQQLSNSVQNKKSTSNTVTNVSINTDENSKNKKNTPTNEPKKQNSNNCAPPPSSDNNNSKNTTELHNDTKQKIPTTAPLFTTPRLLYSGLLFISCYCLWKLLKQKQPSEIHHESEIDAPQSIDTA